MSALLERPADLASWLKGLTPDQVKRLMRKADEKKVAENYATFTTAGLGFNALPKPVRNSFAHEYLFQTQSLYA